MNVSLLHLLAEFSWGAHCIALGVTGVACLRLRKRGMDKAFGFAAWVALAAVFLLCLAWLLGWVLAFVPSLARWWPQITSSLWKIANGLLFLFFALFAAGAFRTANRLPARNQKPEDPQEQGMPAE